MGSSSTLETLLRGGRGGGAIRAFDVQNSNRNYALIENGLFAHTVLVTEEPRIPAGVKPFR